jgi:hypothetical protein
MTDYYGTVKGAKNTPTFDNSLRVDVAKLFFTKNNVNYLVNTMYLANKQNGGGYEVMNVFQKLVPRLMIKFARDNNLRELYNSYYADDDETSVCQLGLDTYRDNLGHVAISSKRNWIEAFRGINNRFVDWADQYLKPNTYVPFRMDMTVGSLNEFENNVRDVRGYNLLADDYKELNVWQQFDINVDRSKFRYGNTIPFWQRSMNIRHNDRSNEGFREGNDAYRASLESPIYAYDMRRVRDMVGHFNTGDLPL